MTQKSDITVIPTGGSVAVNLADVAAAAMSIPAPQLYIYPSSVAYDSGGPWLFVTLAKQTHIIEDLACTIDGSPVMGGGPRVNLPDGGFEWEFGPVPGTTGSHTVVFTASITGATISANYTV